MPSAPNPVTLANAMPTTVLLKPCLRLILLPAFLHVFDAGAQQGNEPPKIVAEGRPVAQIVIAPDAPRMVRLAAQELQETVAKISGAELPVATAPADGFDATIFVGRSEFTDALGVTDEGLRHGAFRMVSGPDWIVLIGHDFDFEPEEPWARSHSDLARATEEWDRLTASATGSGWGFPMGAVHRMYNRPTETWAHDEGGSLNAVYEFLRMQGVRWYMPGELGEVIPQSPSIGLPQVDRTVVPDFPLRVFIGPAWMNAPRETVLWSRRLGLNHGYELLGAGPRTHGLANVHAREEMARTHPEHFALIGGRRDPHHACFSSQGLQREAVAYARTVFDTYGEPALQLSPQDGLRMCRCETCESLTASEAVWGFLDRVAREVGETHPDRLLLGAAYTSYREPPSGTAALAPNIAVRINNVGRPSLDLPEQWDWYTGLIASWRERTASGKLVRVENDYHDAVIHPRAIAKDLHAMKGISLGEMNEVSRENLPDRAGQTWGQPGLTHLNRYVNAAFLWDADQDLDRLLDEYFELFYGPARDEMRAAFEHAESSYERGGRARLGLPQRIRFVELLHAARAKAGDSVYGRRIDLILGELDPLEKLRAMEKMSGLREDAKEYRAWNLDNSKWDESWKAARIDGVLDEAYYGKTVGLLDADGGRADPATRFSLLVGRGSILLGVRCEEGPGGALEISATEDGDPAILRGDHVEFLIETDAHAYYRIAVNPAGAIYAEDMSEGGEGSRWASNAEAAVAVDDSAWTLELRIPIVPEEEGAGDPLHHILYRRLPSDQWPWHFNIARVRPRGGVAELSVFAPIGDEGPRDRLHFGRLVKN